MKLSRIQAALKANERIEILREKSLYCTGSPLGPDDILRHWQSYLIAPRVGIYTLDGLNSFAATLFPSIKPDDSVKFEVYLSETSGLYLQLGQLRFVERIGKQRTIISSTIVSTDEEFSRQKGFVGDTKKLQEVVQEEQNKRYIDVIVCPDRKTINALELNRPNEGFGLLHYRAIIKLADLVKAIPEFQDLYKVEHFQQYGYEPT